MTILYVIKLLHHLMHSRIMYTIRFEAFYIQETYSFTPSTLIILWNVLLLYLFVFHFGFHYEQHSFRMIVDANKTYQGFLADGVPYQLLSYR